MSKSISEKIIELRKSRGLTQEQLGEKLGVSGQAVSKWEKGSALPDILLLPDLCDALGTTLDGLLKSGDAKNPNAVADFCSYAYAHEKGRAAACHDVISRLFGENGMPIDGCCIKVIMPEEIMVSDTKGMGFVAHGEDFRKAALSIPNETISKFLEIFTDASTLSVFKLVAAETVTLEEICEKLGMEKAAVQSALFELLERKIITIGVDRNKKRGYIPDRMMAAAMAVLAGCRIAMNDGYSWVSA